MNFRKTCFIFGLLGALATAGNGQASDRQTAPGFSGHVQPVLGVISTQSLSSVGDDNKRIGSLDQEADSETEFFPAVLWNVGYTFEGGHTRVWAGSTRGLASRENVLFETGVSHTLGDGTRLTVAYMPDLLGEDVWQDPFLVGQDRSETDLDSQGFRVAAESVFGFPLGLSYSYTRVDVAQDLAGESLLLSRGERDALKRSGSLHRAGVRYDIDLGHGFVFSPSGHFSLGDADGTANQFDLYGGELSLAYTVSKISVFASGGLSHSEYDGVNPVFGMTREDDTCSASLGVTYHAPFGLESVSVTAMSMYRNLDSNIRFYDREELVNGVGVNWVW